MDDIIYPMTLQKFSVEIRYVPDPSFLDNRGILTKKLISKEFQNWLVLDNRIELTNKDGRIFATYANIGFTTFNKEKLDNYIDTLDEILKHLGDIPPIRWGVRIQQLTPSKSQFSALVKKYKENFFNFQPNHFSKIGGELADLAINYIFKKDHESYHIQSGPMKAKQAEGIFDKKADVLPKNGIFIDLDMYREEDQFYKDDFRRSRIIDFVKKSFKEGQSIIDDFEEKLNGR